MFRSYEDGYGHNFSLPTSPHQNINDISQFLTSRTMSFSGMDRADELQPDDDMSDDGYQLLGEKKRRLNLEQVQALEKSFELGNKLGPDRKMQLARALGLKPRQIAIWFQNRRARWKTKKLEKDYDILRTKFESIKAHNDDLKSQNKELQSQLLTLKRIESSCTINLNRDNYEAASWNINDLNTKTSTDEYDPTQTILYHPNDNKSNPIINVFPADSINPDCSSRPDNIIPGHRIDNPASNEPFYNIFMSGMRENQELWPWPEQQNNFN